MIHNQKLKRLRRVRSKIAKNIGIPRLSVFRSNRHTWVQIIDDKHGKTLVAASSKAVGTTKGTKSEIAAKVGEAIADKAIKKNIIHIRFDRGLYKYHGRVKAVADAARAKGLKF
jgi:large subunit ribosomal protein L18